MTYNDTLDFLFNKTLIFQHVGAPAYKPGLETTLAIAGIFGNPHQSFRSIHIAGTNGKGSTAHLLAAILQESGYTVGLYTSPHLTDFRERIRVNGEKIEKESVVRFVEQFLESGYHGRNASFFELTTIMAFDYFRKRNVDIAVIETGLGGRLDSTNIITPELSVITNISFDHTQFLGDTLAKIAAEKAGIIKAGIPAIIGETTPETKAVFLSKAAEANAPLLFAEEENEIVSARKENDRLIMESKSWGILNGELAGDCQLKNANTVLNAVNQLTHAGYRIHPDAVRDGFANVCNLTGLMGRWMKIADRPRTFCDTGHNIDGIRYIVRQFKEEHYTRLRIVIGFVSDKDFSHILEMLPPDADYYFTQASIPRALDKDTLQAVAQEKGLQGASYPSVEEAYRQAVKDSATSDMIYVGGSTFIVADLLSAISGKL